MIGFCPNESVQSPKWTGDRADTFATPLVSFLMFDVSFFFFESEGIDQHGSSISEEWHDCQLTMSSWHMPDRFLFRNILRTPLNMIDLMPATAGKATASSFQLPAGLQVSPRKRKHGVRLGRRTDPKPFQWSWVTELPWEHVLTDVTNVTHAVPPFRGFARFGCRVA